MLLNYMLFNVCMSGVSMKANFIDSNIGNDMKIFWASVWKQTININNLMTCRKVYIKTIGYSVIELEKLRHKLNFMRLDIITSLVRLIRSDFSIFQSNWIFSKIMKILSISKETCWEKKYWMRKLENKSIEKFNLIGSNFETFSEKLLFFPPPFNRYWKAFQTLARHVRFHCFSIECNFQ